MSNIIANWPAPSNISALTTCKTQGNLALHTGDNPKQVMANRLTLLNTLSLPSSPEWLDQTHSTHCVLIEEENDRVADAAITRAKDRVLAIMTADCLPILLCNKQGTEIGAIHAGWKGLANGIIENTLLKMHSPSQDILAWIGPSICQACFEIGGEVRDIFLANYSYSLPFFTPHTSQKWLGNLAGIAEKILQKNSVLSVYHSAMCTFEKKEEFFSYRRDKQRGRITSLIWFNH